MEERQPHKIASLSQATDVENMLEMDLLRHWALNYFEALSYFQKNTFERVDAHFLSTHFSTAPSLLLLILRCHLLQFLDKLAMSCFQWASSDNGNAIGIHLEKVMYAKTYVEMQPYFFIFWPFLVTSKLSQKDWQTVCSYLDKLRTKLGNEIVADTLYHQKAFKTSVKQLFDECSKLPKCVNWMAQNCILNTVLTPSMSNARSPSLAVSRISRLSFLHVQRVCLAVLDSVIISQPQIFCERKFDRYLCHWWRILMATTIKQLEPYNYDVLLPLFEELRNASVSDDSVNSPDILAYIRSINVREMIQQISSSSYKKMRYLIAQRLENYYNNFLSRVDINIHFTAEGRNCDFVSKGEKQNLDENAKKGVDALVITGKTLENESSESIASLGDGTINEPLTHQIISKNYSPTQHASNTSSPDNNFSFIPCRKSNVKKIKLDNSSSQCLSNDSNFQKEFLQRNNAKTDQSGNAAAACLSFERNQKRANQSRSKYKKSNLKRLSAVGSINNGNCSLKHTAMNYDEETNAIPTFLEAKSANMGRIYHKEVNGEKPIVITRTRKKNCQSQDLFYELELSNPNSNLQGENSAEELSATKKIKSKRLAVFNSSGLIDSTQCDSDFFFSTVEATCNLATSPVQMHSCCKVEFDQCLDNINDERYANKVASCSTLTESLQLKQGLVETSKEVCQCLTEEHHDNLLCSDASASNCSGGFEMKKNCKTISEILSDNPEKMDKVNEKKLCHTSSNGETSEEILGNRIDEDDEDFSKPSMPGVRFDTVGHRWVASWSSGGRQIQKYFPSRKFGNAKARWMAMQARQEAISLDETSTKDCVRRNREEKVGRGKPVSLLTNESGINQENVQNHNCSLPHQEQQRLQRRESGGNNIQTADFSSLTQRTLFILIPDKSILLSVPAIIEQVPINDDGSATHLPHAAEIVTLPLLANESMPSITTVNEEFIRCATEIVKHASLSFSQRRMASNRSTFPPLKVEQTTLKTLNTSQPESQSSMQMMDVKCKF